MSQAAIELELSHLTKRWVTESRNHSYVKPANDEGLSDHVQAFVDECLAKGTVFVCGDDITVLDAVQAILEEGVSDPSGTNMEVLEKLIHDELTSQIEMAHYEAEEV